MKCLVGMYTGPGEDNNNTFLDRDRIEWRREDGDNGQRFPTDPFTPLELQNPSIDVSELR